MLPHEKTLVQRLTDEPFALLGVNSDGPHGDVLPRLQEEGINWRNAIDDTPQGPWATKWNVSGWPTLYLIDAKGIIRHKWVGSPGEEAMSEALEKLVQEARSES